MNTTPTLAQRFTAVFGLTVDVPPALATLLLELIKSLPDDEGRRFPAQVRDAIRPGADLSLVALLFARWLLMDSHHGAVHLARREDVREAVVRVATMLLLPAIERRPLDGKHGAAAMFAVSKAQTDAWHAFQAAKDIEGMQPRVEWMVASAAAAVIYANIPDQLLSATLSCAVAWNALFSKTLTDSQSLLFRAMRSELLLLLLAQAPAPVETASTRHFNEVSVGDRVQFDDADHGPQKGKVLSIMCAGDGTASAVVAVDHAMEGIVWNVPLTKLCALQAEPA